MSKGLEYELGLNIKEFLKNSLKASKSLTNLSSEANKTGKACANMNALIGKIGGSVAIASKALDIACKSAESFTKAIVGSAMDGLKSAGAYEKMATKLQILRGSAREAGKEAKIIDDFANTSIFDRDDVEETAKQLLASGTALKDLKKEMSVIANVAAATDTAMSTFSAKLMEASEKGAVGMDAIAPIMKAGIPIIEELARTMGIPVYEAKRLAQEGSISLGNFKAVLNDLGGSGGKFAGAMQSMAKTTPGMLEQVEKKWEALKRKVMEPINDALKPVLEFVMEKIDAITSFTETSSEAIKKLWAGDKLGDFLKEALVGGLKEAANYGVGALKWMVEMVIADFKFRVLNIVSLFTGEFNEAIAGIGSALWKTMKWAVGKSTAFLIDGLSKAGALLAASLTWAVEQARYAIEWMITKAKALMPGVEDKSNKITKPAAFSETFNASHELLKKSGIGEFAADLDKAAEEALKGAGDDLKKGIKSGSEVLARNAKDTYGQVQFGKANLFDSSNNLKGMENILESVMPGGWQKWTEAFTNLFKAPRIIAPKKTDDSKEKKPETKIAGASTEKRLDPNLLADATKKAADASLKLAESLKESANLAAMANGRYRQAAKAQKQKEFDDRVSKLMNEGGLSQAEARERAVTDMSNEAKASIRSRRPGEKARQERADRRAEREMAHGGRGILEGVTMGGAGGDPNRYAPGFGRNIQDAYTRMYRQKMMAGSGDAGVAAAAAKEMGRPVNDLGSAIKRRPFGVDFSRLAKASLGGGRPLAEAMPDISPAATPASASAMGSAPGNKSGDGGWVGTIKSILTELQTIRTSVDGLQTV